MMVPFKYSTGHSDSIVVNINMQLYIYGIIVIDNLYSASGLVIVEINVGPGDSSIER